LFSTSTSASFVQRDGFEERTGLLVLGGKMRWRFRLIQLERRNTHLLAHLEPVLRIGALAVQAHFAFADDALDMAERQAGESRLEESVEPHSPIRRPKP
jgi:hypothetical protein